MKFGKISFFKRMYLAITDFRMYPYIQKEKLTTSIGYFFKLVILMSIIIGAFFTSRIFKELPGIIGLCERIMPEFTMQNGTLVIDENISRSINDEWYLVANDDVSYSELENFTFEEDEEYDYYVLALSDTLLFLMQEDGEFYELGGIMYEPVMNFNKSEMVDALEEFYGAITSKLLVWLSISIGIFFAFILIRIWTLIMYLLSTYIINIMFGLMLNLKDYLKIAIYVSTLPIILETVAIVVVGNVSETVNFIIVLISCVYIFYALRALKLDELILGGSGKRAEEKIKNALERAQKELEKQLEELEQQDEKETEEKRISREEEEALNREIREKEENLLKAQREYQEVIQKAVERIEEKAESKTTEEKNKDENKKE